MRQYGTVILTRPVSHVVLTGVFVALVLLLIAFFVFFETTRKAHVQGMLVPTAGVIRVYSSQVGVINDIRVKEGQFVREGDILFLVSSERSNMDTRSTEALISDLLALQPLVGQSAISSVSNSPLACNVRYARPRLGNSTEVKVGLNHVSPDLS